MTSLLQLAEELSNYGITFNQAKAYIATAKLVVASVSQISKESNVPREEVYRMLPKLQNLGLVEKTLERPMRIKATNIESVLSLLINHKKDKALQKIHKLEAKKEQILEDFRGLRLESKPKEATHFTVVTQRHAIIQKLVSMIVDAKKIATISISRDELIHLSNNYSLQIRKALSRNVEFRILLENSEYDDTIKDITKGFETHGTFTIRFVDRQQSNYFLVDYKEALVSTSREYIGVGNGAYLWTDNNHLVGLIRENFEVLWLTSQHAEAVKIEDEHEKLRRYLRTLQPSEHMLFIYRSLESKHNVLSNYLKVGLERGEAVVYVSSEDSYKQVRDVLMRFGVDVEKNEKTGALKILGFDEFYIVDGKFRLSNTTDLIKQIYNDAVEKGFSGCRVFGEMSCFHQHNLNNELIEYEKALHRILDVPIIGMCAYNADIFDKCDSAAEEYKELLKAHSKVLFMGLDKHLDKFEIR